MEFSHYSVMLKETIEELKVKPDGIYWKSCDDYPQQLLRNV